MNTNKAVSVDGFKDTWFKTHIKCINNMTNTHLEIIK